MSIRPSWKVALSLVAIFLAGGAVGSLVTIGVIRHKIRQHDEDASRVVQTIMRRMESELDLTQEQRALLQPIVEHAGAQFRGLQALVLARAKRIFQEVDGKVSAHLTAEQRARLERLVRERQERWRRLLGREPSGDAEKSDVTQ